MWPWETEPHSVAHGILDDETYDWLAVVEGMLGPAARRSSSTRRRSGAGERARRARRPGSTSTPPARPGLAGLLALREQGCIRDDERVAVLFTGVSRVPAIRDKGID